MVDPLPHQITAVYGEMLPRQPLRFLLADDPGAGKTIMAGLLIKELLIRGDLHRCMIVCPGNLSEQWQDELYQRFQLDFKILTNDALESARTGKVQADGRLRFIEVKGRVAGALTVTVTRNEILTALNKPDDFILAVGQVEDGEHKLRLRSPAVSERARIRGGLLA
jgi:SNF2 family DNA or RNA helicase